MIAGIGLFIFTAVMLRVIGDSYTQSADACIEHVQRICAEVTDA